MNTFGLAAGINGMLKLGNRIPGTPYQELHIGKLAEFDLHLPNEPIRVPVAIRCHPQEAQGLGELVITPRNGIPLPTIPAADRLWLLELETCQDPYELKVRFQTGQYAEANGLVDVGPAWREVVIEVRQPQVGP